ncbi:MAG: hypothetical protein ABI852_04865, partial [Gemmatimonadaceae bacterium]
ESNGASMPEPLASSGTAIGGAPVDLVLLDAGSPTGSANRRLCTAPTVMVRDTYGNGVASVAIAFVPNAGSGSVDATTVLTSSDGTASVNGWNLSANATQTLVASAAALPGKQVSSTVTLVPAANFGICARFIGEGGTAR